MDHILCGERYDGSRPRHWLRGRCEALDLTLNNFWFDNAISRGRLWLSPQKMLALGSDDPFQDAPPIAKEFSKEGPSPPDIEVQPHDEINLDCCGRRRGLVFRRCGLRGRAQGSAKRRRRHAQHL